MPEPASRGRLHGLALAARLVVRAMRAGRPAHVSSAERLANIPTTAPGLRQPVRITWDRYQVPSIEAANEAELAFGLGVAHAHLRLAQIEAMRRLAAGRVSEVIGPAGIELDRALRLMRLSEAVPAMQAALPRRSRDWAEAFVAGINHQLMGAPVLPYEFRLLDVAREPWTLEQLLLVSRLAAADVSWLVFARLLRGQAKLSTSAWEALWPLLQQGDRLPAPDGAQAAFGAARGSNSAAVSAARSASGAGLIASDPHLSVALPPLWLIAGLHAPGLDVVGLMIPGLPVVALGRNRHIAWGGTSLHAASSELVDVAGEPITVRRETVAVRKRRPAVLGLRETRFGPVVTDGMLLRARRPLALRWVGHAPSDELTAMLDVMRADSVEAFRAALRGFAVPGQTMVVVERHGRAARVLAAHLPRRPDAPMQALACPPGQAWALDDLVVAADLAVDVEDVVASANDRAAPTPVPVGFFFSPPTRARRLRALLGGSVTPAAMRGLALDVQQPAALALRDALLARLRPGPRQRHAVAVLAGWDGAYDPASAGALVFEVLAGSLARRLVPRHELALLEALWTGPALIAARFRAASPRLLDAALRDAARALRRHGAWGGAHRMRLRHPLAALPLVGRWFAQPDYAAPGGNDTLNKTGHGVVRGRHAVRFGACARHVSDLADPDANDFVLLGGQDGWLGSANFADQVGLWRAGRAIRVKLGAEPARDAPDHMTADASFRTTLRPQ